jgi:hypothetical protein
MKRPKAPSRPNYQRKLDYMIRIGALPLGTAVSLVDIEHDSWCKFFQDRNRCNCDPTVKLAASVPAASRN